MTALQFTPPTCDRCAQPLSNDGDDLCRMCKEDIEHQQQFDAFASDLLGSGDTLREVYTHHYGQPLPDQTLSAEAALHNIGTFTCPKMEDDQLLVEVYRGREMRSTHRYMLPLNVPLWLPLQPGDLVLSFHDHSCNRDRANLLSDLQGPHCLTHRDEFLKVIAIE